MFLIAGGFNDLSTELFNPSSRSGCRLPDLPDERYQSSACGSLLCGGEDEDSNQSCLKFDGANFTRTRLSLVDKRINHLCWAGEGEDDILLLGGSFSESEITTETVKTDGSQSSASFNMKYNFW